jgi:hypothetical protein
MKCQVCEKEAKKNSVVCSDRCQEVRLRLFELVDKYFPTHGCDNCWSDGGGKCTEQCRKEFREGGKFATDLWDLVFLCFTPSVEQTKDKKI